MANSSENTSENRSAAAEPGPLELLSTARARLTELTGMEAESVSSFVKREDGWLLEVEVLEVPRIPATTSLLGTYEVTLDARGELTGYRRIHRYERGRADHR
ncbi:gas vesicle protein GvpO [Streptomyces sp. SLBN-118]|uniref:gas vesicle protein GvpO n=1 Tax=Streptomyces sp. SLBN-118 TaxID=2768454 RepID=UPI001153BB74|nr:gas vesicle protein [Streptomyces sp. SLBN-118]TQK42618.1 gas vesicle protein GvpO [Streptomyces sp. SLBN-118]